MRQQHLPGLTAASCTGNMPELEKYFHYRNLDVSTVKELVKRWTGNPDPFDKESTHLALNDIRDSIDELRHYRALYFNC